MHVLIITLVVLILAAVFFSSAETSMMSINRYRLRHLARSGHRAAKRVSTLLERTDRLLSVILLGNTCANIFASAVATMITVQLFGKADHVIFAATLVLTIIVLIFGEIFPKNLATIYSQRIAFLVSYPLMILLKILWPLVFIFNGISSVMLKLFRVQSGHRPLEPMTHEELRTVVGDANSTLSRERVSMLLGLLDLQKGEVQDIMVARPNIVGIDLNDPLSTVEEQLKHTQYGRVPLYRESIDQLVGVVYVREALKLLHGHTAFSTEALLSISKPAQFIPETVSLYAQLIQFQKSKTRMAFCVDEYGHVQGLVTIHDILEEIVGEFTTDSADELRTIDVMKDGSSLVRGSVMVRELNRELDFSLPLDGPKTLSGLVIEYLESIPEAPLCLVLHGLRLEITRVSEHRIEEMKIIP